MLACIGISAGSLNESNSSDRHIGWTGRLTFKRRLDSFSAYGGIPKKFSCHKNHQ